jgi:hypothetical protein
MCCFLLIGKGSAIFRNGVTLQQKIVHEKWFLARYGPTEVGKKRNRLFNFAKKIAEFKPQANY